MEPGGFLEKNEDVDKLKSKKKLKGEGEKSKVKPLARCILLSASFFTFG